MSDPVALVTSTLLDREAIKSFVLDSGGFASVFAKQVGALQDGERSVEVYLSPSTLQDVIEDSGSVMTRRLGTPCQTCIILEVSRTDGSDLLALDFCIAFAKRWPALLHDLDDCFLDLAEMELARRLGEPFYKIFKRVSGES